MTKKDTKVNPPIDKEWPRVAYPTIPWTDLFRLEEVLKHDYNAHLTGLNIKTDEDGWFVILKARIGDRAVVHFTGGQHWQDALEVIGWEVGHRALNWRDDRYK